MLRGNIIGRIGRDASIKEVFGNKIMHFPVCSSEKFIDKDGNNIERVTWVTCFMKTNFSLCDYLKKGTLIEAIGDLKVEVKSYQGKTTAEITINVFRVELLAKPSEQKTDGNLPPKP